MSALTARLQANKANSTVVMYSAAGASFQEWAIAHITVKGTPAHMMIGKLVTAINNNQISQSEAEAQFLGAYYANGGK